MVPHQSSRTARVAARAVPVGAWLGAVPLVLLAVQGFRRRWTCDDAFICFRIVEHWVAGHGPVFNVGERVEAYTNPAWIALLAAARRLGAPLETGAVYLGLLLALVGLAAAQLGAQRLWARRLDAETRRARAALPLGALVLAALPPVWDFATSGLETGLAFAWLGATFWLVTRALDWRERAPWVAVALAIGIGPLVRPDLALQAAAFGVALAVARWSAAGDAGAVGRAPRRLVALAGWMLLPVVAYEIFRMGYFAALVSNSALTKLDGSAHWGRGRLYLRDFAATYGLIVPLGALAIAAGAARRTGAGRSGRAARVLGLGTAAAALLHGLFVVRVGGDFMHARLLLPSLWTLLLPVASIPVGRRTGRRAAAALPQVAVAAVVVWAAVSAVRLRPRVDPRGLGPFGIADERAFYVHESGRPNPVAAADHARMVFARDGATLHRVAADPDGVLAWADLPDLERGLLIIDKTDSPEKQTVPRQRVRFYALRAATAPGARLVVGRWNIGITGFTAGPNVHLVDRYGLADPIASRLETRPGQRPGHGKQLANTWIVARFAGPAVDPSDPALAAARRALACGRLVELLEAVRAPLGPARWARNLRLAPALHRLRIPADPQRAEAALCGRAPANPESPG
jgi:arabinofuranosyltransferase